jgi:hypothetical protein
MRISKTVAGRISLLIVLGFAVCAFWPAAALIADNQVERPFHIGGDLVVWVNLLTCDTNKNCEFVSQDWGEATHFGRFTNQSAGTVNLNDGTTFATGVITAANGDQIYFERDGGLRVMVKSGTGRFQNATGEFVFTELKTVGESLDFPILTLKATYKGIGIIQY